MSQIPDAFKGHDLTGWTVGLNDPETLTYFRRMTAIGPTIIRLRFTHNTSGFQWMPECERLNQEVLHYAGFEFEEAIKIANEWASREQFGGWAPAPIGYVLESDEAMSFPYTAIIIEFGDDRTPRYEATASISTWDRKQTRAAVRRMIESWNRMRLVKPQCMVKTYSDCGHDEAWERGIAYAEELTAKREAKP